MTKINSSFRSCHGYPNCGEEINKITWLPKKTCDMFHDDLPVSEHNNTCPRLFICNSCKKSVGKINVNITKKKLMGKMITVIIFF